MPDSPLTAECERLILALAAVANASRVPYQLTRDLGIGIAALDEIRRRHVEDMADMPVSDLADEILGGGGEGEGQCETCKGRGDVPMWEQVGHRVRERRVPCQDCPDTPEEPTP